MMVYTENDEVGKEFLLNNFLNIHKENMQTPKIIIRKRMYYEADELSGYEAYINTKHWIFGIGAYAVDAIKDLRNRLLFENEYPDDFDRLGVKYKEL